MSECGAAQSVRRVRCCVCGKATHRLGALDNVQLLHDVVECGPLCRLRLQAAAHEGHYVLQLLSRGVRCIGRQHVAFFRQLQLLLARNVILHHLRDADVLKALIGNAARQYLVHDHAEAVNFR